MPALPTPEIEAAAALLRENQWIVTPPSEVKYGCHCDLFAMPPGTEPDGCVIDEDRPRDCIYATGRKKKETCAYWKAWTRESIAQYWKEMQKDDSR